MKQNKLDIEINNIKKQLKDVDTSHEILNQWLSTRKKELKDKLKTAKESLVKANTYTIKSERSTHDSSGSPRVGYEYTLYRGDENIGFIHLYNDDGLVGKINRFIGWVVRHLGCRQNDWAIMHNNKTTYYIGIDVTMSSKSKISMVHISIQERKSKGVSIVNPIDTYKNAALIHGLVQNHIYDIVRAGSHTLDGGK